MQGRTELCFDVGESARTIETYKPDNCIFRHPMRPKQLHPTVLLEMLSPR